MSFCRPNGSGVLSVSGEEVEHFGKNLRVLGNQGLSLSLDLLQKSDGAYVFYSPVSKGSDLFFRVFGCSFSAFCSNNGPLPTKNNDSHS